MTFLIILAVIAGVAMIFIAAMANKGERNNQDKDRTPIKARPLLSTHEIPMFVKLRKALPEHIVLTQVALSALLCTNGQVTRNKLNRYRADFVILDKDLQVIAIIDFNDVTQSNNNEKFNERESMLNEADYRIIRYSHMPDIDKIQRDLLTLKASYKKSEPVVPTKKTNSPTSENTFFDQDF